MDKEEIYTYLCNKDPRNPFWIDLYGYDSPSEVPIPRQNCSCDNCFYRRDRLALALLEQKRITKYLGEKVTSYDRELYEINFDRPIHKI